MGVPVVGSVARGNDRLGRKRAWDDRLQLIVATYVSHRHHAFDRSILWPLVSSLAELLAAALNLGDSELPS